MLMTNNPVFDAEAYYGMCEQRQAEWEARCHKCIICGEPIDPNFDEQCINLWENRMHIQCMSKKMSEAELAVNANGTHAIFLDLFTEAIEESYMESTPVPD